MLYAIKNGQKVRATQTGERANCPFTGAEMIAKCGAIKINHWAYVNASEGIDLKGETEWHLKWKSLFPAENCEVQHIDNFGNRHIADVDLGDLVIEFQHSPISSFELIQRELFYTSIGKQFVWVLDGETFLKDFEKTKTDTYIYSINYLSNAQREKISKIRGVTDLDLPKMLSKTTTFTFKTNSITDFNKHLKLILKDYQISTVIGNIDSTTEAISFSSNKKIYQMSRSPIFIDIDNHIKNTIYSCVERKLYPKHKLVERKCSLNYSFEKLCETIPLPKVIDTNSLLS